MLLHKAFVFFSFVLYAHALSAHHIARPPHHRAIGARFAAHVADAQPLQPRRLSKRCRSRPSPSYSSLSASSPTSPPEQSHTPHSAYAPPPPSTAHAHTHTPSPPPPPSTSRASPPTTTSGSGGGGGDSGGNLPSFMIGIQMGQATYYQPGLGACGFTNSSSDYIAAVSHLLFDVFPGYNDINPNYNPVCRRQIKVHYKGASVIVMAVDRCQACKLRDLDLSPTAFGDLTDLSVGRFDMDWEWVV